MKREPEQPLFSLPPLHDDQLARIDRDDIFFEEAFSPTDSAWEPARAFVGRIITRDRLRLGATICFIGLGILLLRCAQLQIWHGNDYRLAADRNRIRVRVIPAKRGIITDRYGLILAKNAPTFSLLSESNADDETELIDDDLPYDKALAMMAAPQLFPGFRAETSSLRSYATTNIPTLSHLLGYTGLLNEEEYEALRDSGYRRYDRVGKQGVEKVYETSLRGTFGEEVFEVDAYGNTERIISKRDPEDGKNLTLTIDSELQAYIENSVAKHIKGISTRAAVIVMNPKNGEVLSLVSIPSFDANLFAKGIDTETYNRLLDDPNNPLFPRATAGEFPSGSTIKPVFAAAALMEGIVTPSTTFLSTGGISVGPWFFPDWRAGGHGITNVYHAIADSVNTYFYMIGGGTETFNGLGVEKLMSYAAQFGFGKPTGLDLPGEADGFLPSKEWKQEAKGEQWYIGDTYHVAIGQGDFLATPLQIAQSTAIFANDGVLITPHLSTTATPTSKEIVEPEIAQVIKDAMRQTVTVGSARSLSALPIAVAGKTGTAQWSTVHPPHAWFTGFGPFEDPEIVVTILVEEGSDEYLAVPIAYDIFDWYATHRMESP